MFFTIFFTHIFSISSKILEKYPRLEKEVYEWIIKQPNKKIAVKYARICSHAKREATKMGLDVSDFKFSNNWINRFCNRYKLSSRCKTHQAQECKKTPEEKMGIVSEFLSILKPVMISNHRILLIFLLLGLMKMEKMKR